MAESTIRQRSTFKFSADVPEIDENRVLDEQEQEHVLQELHKENERITKLYQFVGYAGLSLSMFLQVSILIGVFNAYGSGSSAWAVWNILLSAHAILLVREQKTLVINNNTTIRVPAYFPTQLGVLVPPLSVLLFSSNAPPSGWALLFIPLCATALVWICLSAKEEGEKGIKELEQLKYNAKGA